MEHCPLLLLQSLLLLLIHAIQKSQTHVDQEVRLEVSHGDLQWSHSLIYFDLLLLLLLALALVPVSPPKSVRNWQEHYLHLVIERVLHPIGDLVFQSLSQRRCEKFSALRYQVD